MVRVTVEILPLMTSYYQTGPGDVQFFLEKLSLGDAILSRTPVNGHRESTTIWTGQDIMEAQVQ